MAAYKVAQISALRFEKLFKFITKILYIILENKFR